MSANKEQPILDDRAEFDEHIPEQYESGRLTWLDEIGLDKELDSAAAVIAERLEADGVRTAPERVKLALAHWLQRELLDRLSHSESLLREGPDHFLSVLEEPGDAPATSLPPPAATPDALAPPDTIF